MPYNSFFCYTFGRTLHCHYLFFYLYEFSKNRKIDIGSEEFCQMYNNKSYYKAFQLFQITDKLNSHFINSGNLYRFLSNIGFSLVDKNQSLKNKITKYAMGV